MTTTIPCAAVIVTNSQDQVLLVQRGADVKRLPSAWESPGGKIDAHEDPETAAIREVFEETGIQLSNLELFERRNVVSKESDEIFPTYIFFGKSDDEPVIGEPDVFQNVQWCDKQDVAQMNLAPYCRDDFKRLGWIT